LFCAFISESNEATYLTKQQIKAALKLATDREIAAELGYRKNLSVGTVEPELIHASYAKNA
jgi:hypothetical protein